MANRGFPSNGKIQIGSTGAQPVEALPTNGTNISWTAGAGSLTANLSGQVAVANGGTGQSTLTNHGVLVGAGTSAITQLAAGTADTVLRSGGASADPAYSTNFKISSADVMTNTSQPCFLAYNANTASNVTGDSTVYTCQFDTVSFDNAGNFASNTFTAPRTGRYQFSSGMYAADLGAAHTLANFQLVTSGGILLFFLYCNPVAIVNGTNLLIAGSAIVPMTAGDTCNMRLVVSGSTKTVDWVGGALNANPPYFSGQLMC